MIDYPIEYWKFIQKRDRTLCYDGKCCTAKYTARGLTECKFPDKPCDVKYEV